MRILRSIGLMKRELSAHRRKGRTVGFVPTMGYLHEGHLSLVRRARKETDISVVSIFVNPAQFGPKEDYLRYPRDMKRDASLCRKAGVSYIFYPDAKSMYPAGYSTYVRVRGLTENLCGRSRPSHFEGVTTVVAKLLNIIRPDRMYLGQKDAQQAIVLKRMSGDLDMDTDIVIMPTVREKDGLAMSSRNRYLSADERSAAPTIYRALQEAGVLIKSGNGDAAGIISGIRSKIRPIAAKIDYVSVVDTKELKDMKNIKGEALIAVAAWVGKTRLIDNIIVRR
ncbi:MAG: pantoate--beta-alanine ligase [Candidatus Omnitrophota bacterium]